jgi:hypothetical protein
MAGAGQAAANTFSFRVRASIGGVEVWSRMWKFSAGTRQ